MMRLWTVFELLVNVFQGCITVWFVKSYLGTSKNGLLKKISGVFFATAFYVFGTEYEFFIAIGIVSMLMIITVSDINYFIIPDEILNHRSNFNDK